MTESRGSTYLRYVADADHMRAYAQYQERYSRRLRDSDKVLIDLVRETLPADPGRGELLSLLDVGCSTGNLLLHLKHFVPGLRLVGLDMAAPALEQGRTNPELAGVEFRQGDLLQMREQAEFDIVVANAVLCVLNDEEFASAARRISASLKPDGRFIVFDWFHPFEQEITIEERTAAFPSGLTFHWRGYPRVETELAAAGFEQIRFLPFHVATDLPKPEDRSDMTTYTVLTSDAARLSFRGALCQPWCHLVCRKTG